jgi:hypothetical protein
MYSRFDNISANIDSEYLKNSGPEYGCHAIREGELVSEYEGVKSVYLGELLKPELVQ